MSIRQRLRSGVPSVLPTRRFASDIEAPDALLVTNTSPQFPFIQTGFASSTSNAWPSANDPIAVPLWLHEEITVVALGWINGSGTMSTNMDVGVYDASWNRLVSTGSTARNTPSVLQSVDVADTKIGPGRIYLVGACDNTTANQQNFWIGVANSIFYKWMGCFDSTTDAFPLPNPLTNMVAAAVMTRAPTMAIYTKTGLF